MGWKADIASIAAVLALKSTGYIGLAYLALAMQLGSGPIDWREAM